MKMVNLTINDIPVSVSEGTSILYAAKKIGVHIPTLCYMNLHGFEINNEVSSCRVCVVEVEGRPNLATACSEKVREGMVVKTNSVRALMGRKTAVELLLSNHPKDCLTCAKNLNCTLQSLANELGIRHISYSGEMMSHDIDFSNKALIKDPNKCVMCRRCETMCNDVQTVGVLSALDRGFDAVVGPAFHLPMGETSCTYCGQCVAVCPTGALTELNESQKVWAYLHDPTKHVVVQVAPAIRVAVGEMFGMPAGSISTGKLCTALRRMGFDAVFDTDWAADLTIMEEASELVDRIQNNGKLPILTSCCPAWVQFFEHQFPDMLDIPSSCESPQVMFGAMAKSYYAEQRNLDPKDIIVVSLMPCIAKKAEASREELTINGYRNVDVVISNREFGAMLKQQGIDFKNLPESDFDDILGESTGAGVIFGTTGGVIEAATRTAYEWITGEELKDVNFTQLRGFEGIRSASVNIGDLELNIGIAHGLGNARKLLEGIRDGKYHFHAIEIMACPGGCIGGGGQPYHHGNMNIIRKRQEAIYREDSNKVIRKSHENPMIKKIYAEYLGKPYGEKAHKMLHTHYVPREKI